MQKILDFDFKIFSCTVKSARSSAGSILEIIKFANLFKEDCNSIIKLKEKLLDVDYSFLSFIQYKDLYTAYSGLSKASDVDIIFQNNITHKNQHNFFSVKSF